MSLLETEILGEIRAEVRGACPEKLLNAAALNGIELWDFEFVDNYCLRISFYESDLEQIRQIADKSMCEIEVEKRQGGMGLRRLAKRRAVLALLLLVTALLLTASSLFIWEIDVHGNEELSRGEILRALKECGIDYGTYWPSVSSDILRSEMMGRLPQIGWMAFNVNGSRAVLLIAERQEKPEIYNEKAAADIVAAKDAVIRKISVLNGKAVKVKGDAVMKGETVISGTMDSITAGSRYICARGQVLSDTWYELNAVTPRYEQGKEPSPELHRRFALVFGKNRINLYVGSGKAIDGCDKIIEEYKLGAEGLFAMPVKLVCEKFQRYSSRNKSCVSREKMEELLSKRIASQVRGEILQQSFTAAESDGLFILTLRAHCTEDIAAGYTYPQSAAGG